jgi:hypothetical protein
MLPFVSLALSSYLKIQMLLKFIDPTLDAFDVFLSQYAHDSPGRVSDFHNYLTFLYPQYSLAVNGIVKTDFPSESDVIGGIYFLLWQNWSDSGPVAIDDPARNSQPNWGGSGFDEQYPYSTGSGFAFYFMSYGAVDQFPPYGIYQPVSDLTAPSEDYSLYSP